MSIEKQNPEELRAENAALRERLAEAEETLRAIRSGEVDALVVGEHLYMLESADIDSNRFRGDVLAQINDVVIAVDNEQRITYLNPAAERQYGVLSADVLGCNLDEIYHFQWLHPENEAAAFTSLEETGIWRGENVHITRSGEVIHVESTVSRLYDRSGAVAGLLAVIRDITERKRAEEERERLLKSEQQARAYAEEVNRAKDDFLAMLSHELRSPLHMMSGWTRFLQMGKLNEEKTRQAIEIIARNVRLQTALIEDLLDVSRIVTGKMRLESEPVSLLLIVHTGLEAVQPIAATRNITIESELEATIEDIQGDRYRLEQVFNNLLTNAIKFTPEGGSITVTLKREGGMAKLIIKDSGIGIAPELLPHIFDRFRQADFSIKRKYSGLGLGLTIVKNLVELHGGTISAHSDGVNTGTTFIINLPLVARHSLDSNYKMSSGNGTVNNKNSKRLANSRVLLVDDNTDALELLSFVLESEGAKVSTSQSANEALRELEGKHFDLLVSDLGMPGMDGYELIRNIRKFMNASQLPAIALTGYVSADDRIRVHQAGFQTHLPKPVDFEHLLLAASRLLYKHSMTASNKMKNTE